MKHQWVKKTKETPWAHCKVCKTIKRFDNKNKNEQCKGPSHAG